QTVGPGQEAGGSARPPRAGSVQEGDTMIRAAALALSVAAAGCMTLDPIPQHQCGNHVVEDHEDCDQPDPTDGSPDTCSNDCTWTCANAACPDGYICGSDNVCRAPSGMFRAGAAGVVFPIDHLTLAQLDDNPALEVVGLSDS